MARPGRQKHDRPGLAERLGFRFLDTGAMYRAVAWRPSSAGSIGAIRQRLVELARQLRLEVSEDQRGDRRPRRDASDSHRRGDGRHALCRQQSGRARTSGPAAAAGRRRDNIVTEGRDQGTVVFPQAECKIYLTASPEERARRRRRRTGRPRRADVGRRSAASPEPARPARRRRAVGPMVAAADAIEVSTDGLTPDAGVGSARSSWCGKK